MFDSKAKAGETVVSTVQTGKSLSEGLKAGGVFHFQCFDKDGNLKWQDKAQNLVVNEGLQNMNTEYFKGSTYNATWYLGLIEGPGSGTTIAAGDTLASHSGWVESTDYSGNRKTATFGTATTADPSVINNSGSPASFSITGTTVIAGAFLASVDTGSSGILFSASDFTSPGDRSVVSGDTLNVSYSFSLDAA